MAEMSIFLHGLYYVSVGFVADAMMVLVRIRKAISENVPNKMIEYYCLSPDSPYSFQSPWYSWHLRKSS